MDREALPATRTRNTDLYSLDHRSYISLEIIGEKQIFVVGSLNSPSEGLPLKAVYLRHLYRCLMHRSPVFLQLAF